MPKYISPFSVDKDEIPDAWKNEIAYKQALSFVSLAQVHKTMKNIQNKTLGTRDFEVRDIIFQNTLPNEEIADFYDFANEHYRSRKIRDQTEYLRSIRENCQMKKFEFIEKYSKLVPTTKEILQTRRTIADCQQLYFYKSYAMFGIPSIGLSYMLKMQHNPIKFRILFFVVTFAMAHQFARFRHTNEIFNNIPPVPFEEAEREREKIINYCYTLDLELVSKYMLYDHSLKQRIQDLTQ